MKLCLPCNHAFEASDWRCPECSQMPVQRDGTFLFSQFLAENNDGFKASHFSELAGIEDVHFWFRNRNRLLVWAVETYFPGARSFLEVGCGTGFVLSGLGRAFPQMQLAGGELFLEGLKFARTRLPGVDLYQMDVLRIPFEAEYDVVGAFDVLEHVEEDEAALRQLFRATKPGGGVLLTVPQHPSLWSETDVSSCHKRRYTRRNLVRKMETAGFKILRVTSFMTLLLPCMWISRRISRFTKRKGNCGEFQLRPSTHSFFEMVLRLESHFIRLGIDLPAGGSLLLAARRPDLAPIQTVNAA
jgi:SAM-dependent methyltransferase